VEPLPNGPDRQQALITFLTTEHFTLQGVRTGSVSETNSRLQIYMGFVSMSVLALALVAQVSGFGNAFFAFALVLLPVAYIFGVATGARLLQTWVEWFTAGQAMARIRRFFVDFAPEARNYLTMPTTDDPMTTLTAIGIRAGGPLRGYVTAYAVVAIVNSVIAGAFGGLLAERIFHRGVVSAIAGGVFLFVSLFTVMQVGRRDFLRQIAGAEVRFPTDAPPAA
jgi:hypothetical protein